MKRILLVLSTLFLLAGAARAQGVVSFGVFYNSLDPYGEWIPLDAGVYGWRPLHIVADWRPYIMGRWAWTSYGWYWISDEPWGWATYHYGRWYYDDFYGWIWIPGYDWAPAWVEWRYGGDYVGWAPLGPYAIWDFHYGIRYRHHWMTPHHWWAFADCRYMTGPALHNHVYRSDENRRFIGQTRGAGSVRYRDGRIETRGPERDFIEQRGRVKLERADVIDRSGAGEQVTRQGSRDRIEVYRPQVQDRQVDMVERPARIREDGKKVEIRAAETDVRVRSYERATGRAADRESVREIPPSRPVERPTRERAVEPKRLPDDRTIESRTPVKREPERAVPRREVPERTIERKPEQVRPKPQEPARVRETQRPVERPPQRTPEVDRRRPPQEQPRRAPESRSERPRTDPGKRDRR